MKMEIALLPEYTTFFTLPTSIQQHKMSHYKCGTEVNLQFKRQKLYSSLFNGWLIDQLNQHVQLLVATTINNVDLSFLLQICSP